MNNLKSILVFFVGFLIVLWNPVSFYLYYSDYDIYHSTFLKLLFWLIPICGIAAILYIRRLTTLSETLQNLVFSVAFIGISLGILIFINFAIGLVRDPEQAGAGLIFTPHSAAEYTTVEFNYKAEINSLGLRNKEISAEKDDGTFRILCFGDSWTFGWGVDLEHSWPMQMERYFKENGHTNIEVINCGQPGKFTPGYRESLSRAVPLLKPDLVLVGVLQLDDLAQLFENKLKEDTGDQIRNPKYLAKAFLMASFGNYLAILSPKNEIVVDIKAEWQHSNGKLINEFGGLRRLRFTTLTDTVQSMFRSGDLNPGLLANYIDFPDRVTIFNNPDHPATKEAIQKMNDDFREMNEVCKSHGAKLMFLNLPMNYFTGHRVTRMPSDILNSYFQENNHIDSIYSAIARSNGLPYFELTQQFKDLSEKNKYFFRYDGHPNENGYREIGTLVGAHLIDNQYLNGK